MAEIPKGDEGQIELRGDASWYRFQKDASQHGGSKGIEKQTMSWIVTGASDEQVDQVNRVRRAERERSWTEEGQVSKGW